MFKYRKPPTRWEFGIGDINPVDHDGGYVVKRRFCENNMRKEGAYWEHQIEYFQNDSEDGTTGTLYIVIVPEDVFEEYDWAEPNPIADSIGAEDRDGFKITGARLAGKLGCSENVKDRVFAVEAIAGYHGWHELDHEPKKITHSDLRKRWRTPLSMRLR